MATIGSFLGFQGVCHFGDFSDEGGGRVTIFFNVDSSDCKLYTIDVAAARSMYAELLRAMNTRRVLNVTEYMPTFPFVHITGLKKRFWEDNFWRSFD